jgi:hypothetical protein
VQVLNNGLLHFVTGAVIKIYFNYLYLAILLFIYISYIVSVTNIFIFSLFLTLYSCSSNDGGSFNPEAYNASLESLEEKKFYHGPSLKNKTGFIDKTNEYGLSNLVGTNFNVVDFDNDGFSDLVILPEYYSQPRFYRFNVHTSKFEKVDSLFKQNIKASYLLFYDLDKDNILDVIVGVLNQKTELTPNPIKIFKGSISNGRLSFAEEQAELPIPAGPAASIGLIDFDLDGDLDLYIGNWFQRNKLGVFPMRDYLLENTGDKYIDSSKLLKTETKQNLDKTMFVNAAPTYATQICDIDQNGFPDILATGASGYNNKMWMNRYKVRQRIRSFENFARTSLYGGDTEGNLTPKGGGRTFSTACQDYNQDGIMDIFLGELTHSYDNELRDKSSILTGSRFKFPPFFIRTEYFQDSFDTEWHQADRRGVWFDYNNDGLMDLLVDNSGFPPHSRLVLFKQYPDHSFESVSKEEGVDIVNPASSVIADFNQDGKMDILTAQSNLRDSRIKKRLYLFENNLNLKEKRPLRFYLRGKKANFHGLNATVILKVRTAEGKIKNRSQNVSYSYGGVPPQNEEGLHFALNPKEKLIHVKVRWPYTKSLNQSRAGLEKVYKLKPEYIKSVKFTLCEDGSYSVGRLQCKK